MKSFLKFLGMVIGLAAVFVAVVVLLLPGMDRWGATDAEVRQALAGDAFLSNPRISYTRAISIAAAPEQVYPWIVQLGAEKGGMYSYEGLENFFGCKLVNADEIHPEWQNLAVGDKVKMCPGDFGPPAYEVAAIDPGRAIIIGHYENGAWIDIWQFVLQPADDGTTRLVLRSQDAKEGWFWQAFRPMEFIMARGMLRGIKERAELTAVSQLP